MRRAALLFGLLAGCTYDFGSYEPVATIATDSAVATTTDSAVAIDTAVVDSAAPPSDTTTVACTDTDGKVFGGHCYFPITTAGRFDTVQATCASRGAHLVTITSAEEEAFVETIRPGRDRWIGLKRTTMFGWITGEALGYTKWEPGEPNGSGECARLRASNQWADQSCTNSEEAICERE